MSSMWFSRCRSVILKVQDLVVSSFHYGFCETFVALFVVKEVFSLLYFVSFVHDDSGTAPVHFFQVNIIVNVRECFNTY